MLTAHSLMDRSVTVALPKEGKPYCRSDFIPQLNSTCGVKELIACGPTAAGHIWQMTFASANAKDRFLSAGSFAVHNNLHRAEIGGVRQKKYRVRVHWVPYWIPMDVVTAGFRQNGLQVVHAGFDNSVVKGLEHVKSGIRTVTVETDQPSIIPHLFNWSFDGQSGRALVTMTGRDPICLKCNQVGHISARCDASYCRQCREYHTENCRQRSWAAAADGRRRQQDPEELDHEEESMGQAGNIIPSADAIEFESSAGGSGIDVENIANTSVNIQESAEIDRIMSSMDLDIISESVADIGKRVANGERPSPSKSFVEDDFPPLQPPVVASTVVTRSIILSPPSGDVPCGGRMKAASNDVCQPLADDVGASLLADMNDITTNTISSPFTSHSTKKGRRRHAATAVKANK